jgi:transposase
MMMIVENAHRPATNPCASCFNDFAETFERGDTLWFLTNAQMRTPERLDYKGFAEPRPAREGVSFHKEFLLAMNATSLAKDQYAAFVGIDWATEQHVLALRASGSEAVERSPLAQTPEAIDGWAQRLRQRFGGRPVAVCLEQSKGALIYALMKYDHLVLFPLNPARLASYRKAFTTSGAKNDPSDAELLLKYLQEHFDCLRPWLPDDPMTRLVRLLVEQRRETLALRTRLTNQLTEQLKRTFPQALELLAGDLTTILAAEFLLRWPSLQRLQQEPPEALRRFYYEHHCYHETLVQQRQELAARAQPLTTDPALLEAARCQILLLARLLRDLVEPIRQYDRRLAELMEQHPDAAIFQSLPGAGEALAPRLLAAFGTDRQRLSSAQEMQTFSGVAPVTKQSGKSRFVQRRLACPKFLLQTFHEFAALSIRYCDWAAAYYNFLKQKGKRHHAAVRALAFKWVRVIFRCWKNRTPYNEATYLASLRKRHAPFLQLLKT